MSVNVNAMEEKRVIVALDFADTSAALAMAGQLDPHRCRVKVGKELFTRGGPVLVEQLQRLGFEVFLDLKFHDIPNTVAAACAAAADLGVWMVNVHALGGPRMLEAARTALAKRSHRPLLIAVTILTSMGEDEVAAIGLPGSPEDNVHRLAALTATAGLDGVVCSPQETAMLRRAFGPAFRLVTPGVRPIGSELGDQTRIATPGQAVRDGADYLVIGRPITRAPVPPAALEAILTEISGIEVGK